MSTSKNRLILIDADGLLYIATYGHKQYEEDGVTPLRCEEGRVVLKDKTLEEVIECVDSLINQILLDTNAEYYAGFLTIGKCFRYDLYSEYKANRKGRIAPKYIKEARQHMQDKWNFVHMDMYEADDLIASVAKKECENYNILIVSTDKDLQQIPGDHYNPKNMNFTNVKDGKESLFSSLITGDSIDNIKGIPGKGIKYVEKLFDGHDSNMYPHLVLDAYIAHFGEEQGIYNFYLNYKLVKLTEHAFVLPTINKVLKEEEGFGRDMEVGGPQQVW